MVFRHGDIGIAMTTPQLFEALTAERTVAQANFGRDIYHRVARIIGTPVLLIAECQPTRLKQESDAFIRLTRLKNRMAAIACT